VIDGRYNIVRRLGSGSMGVVYLADDVFLDRPVAIKVIDPVHAADPQTTERFKKEAQALAKIRHPNVVQVYAFGPHGDSFYFAMEYVAGRSLEEMIDSGETVDVARGLEILRSIASGLGAVHALNLVHRDVKPSNIVIESNTARPVLIDFGLARRKTASNPKHSVTAGTPMYMPPEQATDSNGVNTTYRADIYALACTAYELFTGCPVFDGKDVYEILVGHLKHPPPALSAKRPDLSALDAAFNRALAKDPQKRHESAIAFVDELTEAVRRSEQQRKRDTKAPPSSVRNTGPCERVLLLAGEETVVRQMSRVTVRAVAMTSRTAAIQHVSSASALMAEFMREPAAIVLIDAEACEMHVADLVRALRGGPGGTRAGILVVSRNWQALRPMLTLLGVPDVLPKPLVAQMLTPALERIARRSAPPQTGSA
jgi:eukaryotic-like serine/threonine-protein kinase